MNPKLNPVDVAASAILRENLEARRKSQTVRFRVRLAEVADTDMPMFVAYALQVLHPSLWSLVEDLRVADSRLADAKGVRITEQLTFYRTSLIKSVISAMLFREPEEPFSVSLLEVMAEVWQRANPTDPENPLAISRL